MLARAAARWLLLLLQGIFVGWISSSIWSIAYIKAIRTPFAYKLITGRDIPKREPDNLDDVFTIKTDASSAAPAEDTAITKPA